MVKPLKIAFVELSEGLLTRNAQWSATKASVEAVTPDSLITNELTFGPWLADGPYFSQDQANDSIRAHGRGSSSVATLVTDIGRGKR